MRSSFKIISLILATNSFVYGSSFEFAVDSTTEDQRRAFEKAQQDYEDAQLAQALQESMVGAPSSVNPKPQNDIELDAAIAASLMTPSANSSSSSQSTPVNPKPQNDIDLDAAIAASLMTPSARGSSSSQSSSSNVQADSLLEQERIQREYLRQEQEKAFKLAQEIDKSNAVKNQRIQAFQEAETEFNELMTQHKLADEKRKKCQETIEDIRAKIQNTRDRLKRYGANPNLEKQLSAYETELAKEIDAREEVNDLELTPLKIRIDSAREKLNTLKK